MPNTPKHPEYFPVVAMLFVAVLLLSNIIAQKTFVLGPFTFPAAIILFPLAYIFGDVLTEVYGYARARLVIWGGLACNLLMAVAFRAAIALPPGDYPLQREYELILGTVPRVVLASMIGYWAGEFANSYVLAKMKIFTGGRYLWTRTVGSTVVGQAVDTALFIVIAFAERLGAARHVVVDIDLRAFGGSALTGEVEVPKDRPPDAIGADIPVTYVPARNTIFLSYALAWAETLGARDIFIGVSSVDYSGYPDCRPQYIEAFQRMANLATKAGVEGRRFRIHTPLLHLTKAETIRTGLQLGVDYSLTSSCYDPDPDGLACGACDACLLRLKGFAEAGVSDPIRYRQGAAPAP